jgi:hypothetical protein
MSQHKPRSGADSAFAERRLARIANAIENVREIEKSRSEVRDADRARQAERVRPYGQG